MNNYEVITQIEPNTLKALIKSGYVSVNIIRDLQIYEMVKARMSSNGGKLINATLSVEFSLKNIKDNQIYKIYKRLNDEL